MTTPARGYQSTAFQLYQRIAGPALGETGDAYRVFLFSLFDMFADDLPALFDRHSPFGRLFPRESTFLRLLGLLNATELEPLWGEDETIGWVYQYFNSTEERRRMRKESGAPRNSRELAVRNQFFTPRYVVEFLVDNTLARQWIEMSAGRSALADQCRFLVRRPDEVFLGRMSEEQDDPSASVAQALIAKDYDRLPDFGDPKKGVQAMIEFAHCVSAYERFAATDRRGLCAHARSDRGPHVHRTGGIRVRATFRAAGGDGVAGRLETRRRADHPEARSNVPVGAGRVGRARQAKGPQRRPAHDRPWW